MLYRTVIIALSQHELAQGHSHQHHFVISQTFLVVCSNANKSTNDSEYVRINQYWRYLLRKLMIIIF